jgi:hypothetical protein
MFRAETGPNASQLTSLPMLSAPIMSIVSRGPGLVACYCPVPSPLRKLLTGNVIGTTSTPPTAISPLPQSSHRARDRTCKAARLGREPWPLGALTAMPTRKLTSVLEIGWFRADVHGATPTERSKRMDSLDGRAGRPR